MPALRERQEDIPLLINHFLEIYTKKYQKLELKISKSTMGKLQVYHWPGNIRELRHAVERAVILSDSKELELSDFILQGDNESPKQKAEFDSLNLSDIERWAIRKVLTKYHGNISKAADELGLTRAALYRRMAKYGL